MRITYVGHSTVLIEIGGLRLLTDPLLRGRVAHLRRHSRPPTPAVAERIDAVLLSHLHHDHLDRPSLRRLRAPATVVAPKGSARLLRRSGHRLVHEVEPGDRIELPAPDGGDRVAPAAVRVQATPAEHDGRRLPFGPGVAALGYMVGIGERRLYFAGDTALFGEMANLSEAPRDLDLALLPIAGWGPNLGPGHMDPVAAAEATALLRPRVVVPIHWGTLFPIGMGRRSGPHLSDPPRRFAALAAELAPETEVRVLEPGGSLELDWGHPTPRRRPRTPGTAPGPARRAKT